VNATPQIACVHWKELERASPALSERTQADAASFFQFSIFPLVSVCFRFCRSSQLPLPVPSDSYPWERGLREAGRNSVNETKQTDTDEKNGEKLFTPFPESIALDEATRLAHSAAVASTG
jgi:hypothetical protein